MVNMKLKGGKIFKLNYVLYVPQYVKNVLSLSKSVSKGATMGSPKANMNINKMDSASLWMQETFKTRAQRYTWRLGDFPQKAIHLKRKT